MSSKSSTVADAQANTEAASLESMSIRPMEGPRSPRTETARGPERLEAAADTANEAPSTTFSDFAGLIRLRKHLARERRCLRSRVQRFLVSRALEARCARSTSLAHRTLVDQYQRDDKRAFVALHHAVHEVRDSCEAMRRYAFLEPDLDLPTRIAGAKDSPEPLPSTFLDQLPSRTKADLLHFLSHLRTDPEFLATRLTSLSSSDLLSLASAYQSLDPMDHGVSSSASSPSAPGRLPGSSFRRSSVDTVLPIERLLSFQRRDPLSALLHTVFAETAGLPDAEDLRRTEVWSTVCARLITQGTPGGEQFMRVLLNAWSVMRDWPCQQNLETYLMATLQDGAFLLEPSGRRPSNAAASWPETRSARDPGLADAFYEKAINDLFVLLLQHPHSGGIPLGVHELGRAIMRKIAAPHKQRAARIFIVRKWFFATFLWDAMVHPEVSMVLLPPKLGPAAHRVIGTWHDDRSPYHPFGET